jgi:hypothetical protein
VSEFGFLNLVAMPIFLGLLGFVEPCSIGSTLVVVKQMEGREAHERIAQAAIFAATRAVFVGLLGLSVPRCWALPSSGCRRPPGLFSAWSTSSSGCRT